MKKISIFGKDKKPEISPQLWCTDFNLKDLLNSLKPHIKDSFIVPVELRFAFEKADDDIDYDEFINSYFGCFKSSQTDENGNGPIGYATFDHIEKFSEYLESDWTDIYFFKSEEDAELNVSPKGKDIPKGCFLLLECVDSGHWNVITSVDEICEATLNDFKIIRDNAYSSFNNESSYGIE